MLGALAIVLLSAVPIKIGAPNLTAANVEPNVARVASDHLAQQLTLRGLRVVTSDEMAALLGYERQRQLLACGEQSTSCMAELSQALGVDALMTGSLGKFGGTYTVNVKVVGASDARQLAVFSATATSEGALPEVLTRGAEQVSQQVLTALGRAPSVSTPPVTSVSSPSPWVRAPVLIPSVIGVLGVGAGSVLFGMSGAKLSELDALPSTSPPPDAFRLKREGEGLRRAGFVAGAVGIASLGVAVWMLLSSDRASAPVAFVTPAGVSVAWVGSWP